MTIGNRRCKFRRHLKTAPLLLACGCPHAETIPTDIDPLALIYEDEEMVSIATGTIKPIHLAPSVASVITAADIEAMGATSLREVLESIPGLHVSTSYQVDANAYVFRGIATAFNPQVLVMVNGVRYNNLYIGSADYIVTPGLPLERISRIEVIRGPGSALYGADAFAGTINFVTKDADEINGTETGIRAGSFNSQNAWLMSGDKIGDSKIALSLHYSTTDGHRRTIEADAQSYLDKLYGTSASHSPGPSQTSAERLYALFDLQHSHWQLHAGTYHLQDLGSYVGISGALDPTNRWHAYYHHADLSWDDQNLVKDWDLKFKTNYSRSFFDVEDDKYLHLYPPGSTVFGDVTGDGIPDPLPNGMIGNPSVSERHAQLEFNALYHALDRHKIMIGLGRSYSEIDRIKNSKNFGLTPPNGTFTFPIADSNPVFVTSGTPYTFMIEAGRANNYLFAQDIWSLANDWELTAGVRHDDYSDFGETTNPRLALVWLTRYNLTSKLLYGQAFRSPSFSEMRIINNPVALGNLNVKPETIETIELAFDYRPTGTLKFNIDFYHYDWNDKIDFAPDPGATTLSAQNVDHQSGYGTELAARWRLTPQLNLSGNYAWQRSIDEATDHAAGNAPDHQLYLMADWRFAPLWHLNSKLNRLGEQQRAAGDSRSPLAGYTTVDITLRRSDINQHWQIALMSKNVFDEDVREPSLNGNFIPNDLPQAGRSVFLEAKYHFDR